MLIAIATAFTFQSASALTGLELKKACDQKSGVGNTVCLVYSRGFIDGFVTGRIVGKNDVTVCLPKEGVAAEQARLIVEKYLRDNPEQLHQEAGLLAASAIVGSFPCH
ncbi:Rap1a/Tai family immunity protein [Bradyrhizobium elkanii]|nr:Rap1a/Tai family immunity protein [Bradyrhizobium elkanii]